MNQLDLPCNCVGCTIVKIKEWTNENPPNHVKIMTQIFACQNWISEIIQNGTANPEVFDYCYTMLEKIENNISPFDYPEIMSILEQFDFETEIKNRNDQDDNLKKTMKQLEQHHISDKDRYKAYLKKVTQPKKNNDYT